MGLVRREREREMNLIDCSLLGGEGASGLRQFGRDWQGKGHLQ